MSRNTHLLFELIRVTIGRQTGLSKIPSSDEWQELFELSQKHAIAGVTFAGVRKLQQNGVSILLMCTGNGWDLLHKYNNAMR